MKEESQAPDEPRTPAPADKPRDGTIDFTRYSLDQLNELRDTLNQTTFPLNYSNLLAELQRRTNEAAPPTATTSAEPPQHSPPQPIAVRFTPHDGLRGWLQAQSRRLPLYGAGFVEIRTQEIVLGGWQRNWLGVPYRAEIFIPLRDITDVVQGDGGNPDTRREPEWVRFQYETFGRHRFIEFRTDSTEQATTLAEALPKARSDAFERWSLVREFDASLREAGGLPWITPVLVCANLIVFVAIALTLKTVNLMGAPQMLGWGANFAPLTLHGQWWRLFTALFLHGNIAHVVFNMWALWNVGRLTERLYGNWAFAFLYLGCGVLSGLASIVWDPSRGTLGASGAIFGIFGACILFALLPRSRAAVRVPLALWLSASVFALYNLIAGFFVVGIDNAAHVGGVLSGLALGACLARPLTPEARRKFPARNLAAASALTALGVLAALWQASGLGAQLTGPERFLQTHQWYANGQAENLRDWYQIAAEARSGNLSDITLRARVEQELIPFWEKASARLKSEGPSLPADERQYASLAAEYSRLRLEWARAIVDAAQGNQLRASDATQYEKDSNLVVARFDRLALLANLQHRPRALVNSPWIVAVSNWLTARRWKCLEPPAFIRKPPASSDSKTDGPVARHTAACRAEMLFMSGDYATLDRWMAQSADSIADLSDGTSTLEGIVAGLTTLFDYGPLEILPALGRTADWQQRVPNSIYPTLIQSLIFQSWAWGARGTGYANTISPQAWAIFAQRTEMSATGLREIVERANTNPLWYELSLRVGLDQAQPLEDLRSIFKRGVTEEPDYWPLYRNMLRILMPRWGGSYDDVNRFIHGESSSVMSGRDFAKYARLYWTYSSLEDDDAPLFSGSLATWSTMKEGFEQLQRQHPTSDVILNAYAKFACMAGDTESYIHVRRLLRDRLSSTAWSDKVPLKHCDEQFPTAAARHVAAPGATPPP
jgi:membrane associated rhomboid family serine protease